MRVRVIADRVIRVRDLLHQTGIFFDVFTEDKERGRHTMLIQQLQQFWCQPGIRAVIERQRAAVFNLTYRWAE